MSLSEGRITLHVTLEALAYILASEHQGVLLEFVKHIVVVRADSDFEESLIAVLLAHLKEHDPEAICTLMDTLCALEAGYD